ncbi:MAG: Methyltransferase domain protein [Methanoregula sp. PtaU1.Bin051]|nr:MAG: Methyltransferase domain protein [Methanoregula sp. PtaU1.Bin051]
MNKRRMPHGKSLPEELANAMRRLESLGIIYPEGYYDTIIQKYTHKTVPYPYIVMHIGDARIKRHFFYPDIFKKPGDFLDYGCGTGDAIRQLIRDGYPAERITGYDVNDASIRLGYDLFLDRDDMERRVVVSPAFPCLSEQYDIVYSGSVIHVIGDEREVAGYLGNAHRTLKPNGIFFGSTLGLPNEAPDRSNDGPPRLMRQQELAGSFAGTGFKKIRIVREERPELQHSGRNFCLFQFSAKKL